MRFLIAILVVVFSTESVVEAQRDATSSLATPESNRSQTTATSSYAVIESARYEAIYSSQDLVQGTFQWQLLHRGVGSAAIDLSQSNLALHRLQGETGAVPWGTTQKNRRLVLIEPNDRSMQGEWSKHGRNYPGTVLFDCTFPPALSSQLTILTDHRMTLKASVGHVDSLTLPENSSVRKWTIELGRHRTVTLSLTQKDLPGEVAAPKAEVETVHVARQDGIFVQTDFTLEGLNSGQQSEIEIITPASFVVQSVTSSGAMLSFERDLSSANQLKISLPEVLPRSRVNFRIQGFQPVRWVRKQTFPTLKVVGAIEAKRVTSLRVEAPLELHDIEGIGFFQTGLTKETRGEIWRFEAYTENPKLIVDLGQPRYALRADIHTLHYLDTPLPWVATQLTASVKSGRLFGMTVAIPQEWMVVSVHPLGPESEISSWSMNQGDLEISFKDPVSADSRKSIEILARTERVQTQPEKRIPIPIVRDATTTSIQSDWVLSGTMELDLSIGSRWNKLTSAVDLKQFSYLPAVSTTTTSQTRRSFFNSNVNLDSLPSYRIFLKSELDEAKLEPDEVIISKQPTPELERQGTEMLAGTLRLLTQAESLDDLTAPSLVHHATIELFGQIVSAELQLRLAEDCLLSTVTVDGQAVTVEREGESILFPESLLPFSEVTLIYITHTKRIFLRENCSIALPQTALSLTRFDWTLELPAERNLTSIAIPGEELSRSATHFLFGPLSSNFHFLGTGKDRQTIPRSSFNFSTGATIQQGTKKYYFQSIESAPVVRFESWNVLHACNFGWVAFLACMIVGVGGRLFGSTMIRQVTPYWLFSLIFLQLFSFDESSMICGAMLAGTVISVLLPVEFLRIPEFKNSPGFQTKYLTTSALLLLTVWTIFTRTTLAQDAKPIPSTLAQMTGISYFIRSADYQILATSPEKLIRARLEILTPASDAETLVELTYKGVVFQSGAECLIDGDVQTLIPAVTGGGVVVRIPNPPQQESPPNVSRWRSHIVQFDFILRESDSTKQDPAEFPGIPVILDSTFKLTDLSVKDTEFLLDSVFRNGSIQTGKAGEVVVALGPVDRILRSVEPLQLEGQETEMTTLLNISPARITGQLFLPSEVTGKGLDLVLDIPANVLVTNVTGPAVAQWFTSMTPGSEHKLVVEFKANSPDRSTAVSFLLPTSTSTKGEVIIPNMRWSSIPEQQKIGLRVPNGIALALVPGQESLEILDPADWPQNDTFGRNRPIQVYRLKQGQDLRLTLSEVKAGSRHHLSQTLTVDRTALAWQADVEIEILDLPIFVHQLSISGGMRISSVRMADGSENSLLRFYQEGSRLLIFIPGGQLGNRKLNLSGDVAFTSESLSAIPKVSVINSQLTQESMTVLDKTNWDIELRFPSGASVAKPATKPEDFQAVRTVDFYNNSTEELPTLIRLQPPPTATRVDIATRVQIEENQSWNYVQLLRFSGEETPLKKVTFTVPKVLENVRIGPRYFRMEQVDQGENLEVTIPVPERFSDRFTIQIYSKVPAETISKLIKKSGTEAIVAIPEVNILSARIASRLLFLNENRLVTTPAVDSLPVERKNLPEWIPLQWIEAVGSLRLQAFQVIEGQPKLIPHENLLQDKDPVLHFAETAVWIKPSPAISGVTRLWISGNQRFNYILPFNKHVQPLHVFLPDRTEIPLSETPDGFQVDVLSTEGSIPLTVYWRTETPNDTLQLPPLHVSTGHKIPQILGIVGNESLPHSSLSQGDVSLVDAWIYRWQALLDIAEQVDTPVALESDLHQNLRDCQSVMQEYSLSHKLNEEQARKIELFNNQWLEILEKLTISAGPVISPPGPGSSTFGLLLSPPNSFQKIQWLVPQSEQPMNFDITPLRAWPKWLKTFGNVIVVMLVTAVILWYRVPLIAILSSIQQDPVLRLVVLGSLWFLLLKPLLVSYLLLLLAFSLHLTRGPRSNPAATP